MSQVDEAAIEIGSRMAKLIWNAKWEKHKLDSDNPDEGHFAVIDDKLIRFNITPHNDKMTEFKLADSCVVIHNGNYMRVRRPHQYTLHLVFDILLRNDPITMGELMNTIASSNSTRSFHLSGDILSKINDQLKKMVAHGLYEWVEKDDPQIGSEFVRGDEYDIHFIFAHRHQSEMVFRHATRDYLIVIKNNGRISTNKDSHKKMAVIDYQRSRSIFE